MAESWAIASEPEDEEQNKSDVCFGGLRIPPAEFADLIQVRFRIFLI